MKADLTAKSSQCPAIPVEAYKWIGAPNPQESRFAIRLRRNHPEKF